MSSYQNFFERLLVENSGRLVLNSPSETSYFQDNSQGVYSLSQKDFSFQKSFPRNKSEPKITSGDALLPEEERTLIIFTDPIIVATEDRELADQLTVLGHCLKEIINRPGSNSYLFEVAPSNLKVLKLSLS